MNQPRGRPFEPGNKMGRGRPKGSRNKRTAQAQAILDQYTEPLIKRCVAKALEGNTQALGLCMERILPPFREPGVGIRMPRLEKIEGIDVALQLVVAAVAHGNITPSEGEKIHTILQHHRVNVQNRELEARLTELEKRAPPPEQRKRR